MIFVTAGSMMPFDRLFRIVDGAVAAGLIQGELFGQIGHGKYEPRFPHVRFLDSTAYEERVRACAVMIGHAGIGTIMHAIDHRKPLLALPRRSSLGECVNDHQVATAVKFEALGHLLAFEEDSLAAKLQALGSFVPRPRHPRAADVARRVGDFLESVRQRRGRS